MSKGDWIRPVDKRYEKQAKISDKQLFGDQCRLNHKHDKDCQKEKK